MRIRANENRLFGCVLIPCVQQEEISIPGTSKNNIAKLIYLFCDSNRAPFFFSG